LGLLEHPSSGEWQITAYGRAFLRACYPELEK